MRPNEPDQPDPTQPKFGPCGPNPTRLNPNLDPWGPTRPEIGVKSGSFGFIKYIKGLNPNLNPFRGQPDPIGPVFGSWGPTRPVWTRKLGPKSGWTRKNGSRLAALLQTTVWPVIGNFSCLFWLQTSRLCWIFSFFLSALISSLSKCWRRNLSFDQDWQILGLFHLCIKNF